MDIIPVSGSNVLLRKWLDSVYTKYIYNKVIQEQFSCNILHCKFYVLICFSRKYPGLPMCNIYVTDGNSLSQRLM